MPNFMPKAFTRRKSSGNALEEFDKPMEPSSSFRVMPRNEVQKSATTGEVGLGVRRAFNARPVSSPMQPMQPAQQMQHLRQNSYDESPYAGPGNRGSNGSSAANSSASRFYDTSSSARYSSTSTLPSSAEFENDDLFAKKVPVPHEARDRTSSFTSITGRFAFHRKSGKASGSPTTKNDLEDVSLQNSGRDRAMTASSYASTAHPPKLENLPSTDFGNDFGDLFSSFASQQRKSAILEESPLPHPPPLAMRSESEPMLPPPPKTFASSRPTQPPSPIRVDRTKDVGGSPYSWDSRDSNDALMASPPAAAHSPYNERPPPVPRHSVPLSISPPHPLQPRTNTSPVTERKPGRNGLMKTASLPVEDEDARLVRESFRASRDAKELQAAQTRQNGSSESSVKTPSFSSAHSSIQSQHQAQPVTAASSPDSMAEATPRAKGASMANEEARPLFSKTPPTPQTTRPGVRFESQKPARMTQAEFAVLQRQHQVDPMSDDESDVSDEYIDDDQEEEERKKIEEMRKMRQQQQEKMSAHREMMKKTVGGMNQSFGGSGRPGSIERPGLNRASMSTSELLGNRASYYGGNDEEDETDDIPLGILKEHKFPKLGNRLSHHSSLTNLRSASAQGMRPSSAAGSVIGGSNNLPPFARGLPADLPSEPYLGANLVQQPMRESIGYGAMGPASVYEGSAAGNAQPTLVNMIADAEQAKEARRGGATKIFGAGTTYGQRLPQPGAMQQQMAPGQGMLGLGMGMPQAQAQPQQMFMPQQQMSMNMQQMQMQQMQQMAQLQQQMQLMLQQQQMGIQQGLPPMSMPQPMMQPGMMPQNSFLSPNLGQRPMSMASNQGLGQQRTRSMVNPPTMNFNSLQQQFGNHLAPGYAPSLAPSERSNVGKSARYRPVTQQIHDGSSTVMSQSTVQPGQAGANRLTIRVKAKSPKSQANGANDDDDDDEGWGSPKKKWSAKKRSQSDNQLADFIPAFE